MNKFLFSTLLLAAVFVMASCSNNANDNTKAETMQQTSGNTAKAEDAQQLPAFQVYDVNGNVLNMKSLAGKKVFVNLWASWCPPCRAEIPSIEKLNKTVDTSKVAFVMLSLDNNFATAKKFIQAKKIALPVFYPAEQLPDLFNVPGIPATFIFNENGELIQKIEGGENYNSEKYRQLLGS